jgi:hypothetical protein
MEGDHIGMGPALPQPPVKLQLIIIVNAKLRGRAVGRQIQHGEVESAPAAATAPRAAAVWTAAAKTADLRRAVRRREPIAAGRAFIIVFIRAFDARAVMFFLALPHGVVGAHIYRVAGGLADAGITRTVILALERGVFYKRVTIQLAHPGFTPLLNIHRCIGGTIATLADTLQREISQINAIPPYPAAEKKQCQ